MDYKNLIVEKKDHICIVTINHAPVNAWNLATLEEFEQVVDDIENDIDTRVVIITGDGDKCFSAGFDISDASDESVATPKAKALWGRIDRFEKPVIAAINGYALGGGCELAMCCQFRIMVDTPKALIGLVELNLGVLPVWGGTQWLARLVGRAKATEMILLSKRVGAQEALEIGLISQVSTPEKLMDDALDLAKNLAEKAPIAVGCILKAMAAGAYEGLDEGLKVETEGDARVSKSADYIEGFTAFKEKRKPVFTGK